MVQFYFIYDGFFCIINQLLSFVEDLVVWYENKIIIENFFSSLIDGNYIVNISEIDIDQSWFVEL